MSDLHVGFPANRELLQALPQYPEDWLIVAGDVGETISDLELAMDLLVARFARVIWVPGNHELWTTPEEPSPPGSRALRSSKGPHLRGEQKYEKLVEACRARSVLTPEDPYPTWPGDGPPCVIAPLFLLYDYSFRPDHVSADRALDWAAEANIVCADESLLEPTPHASRSAWCMDRVARTEARLAQIPEDHGTILVNHYPLRYEHVTLPLIPRFSLWCGTRATADWHLRFRATCVVYGHLHVPATRWLDGVRFEEVSVGYPRQWSRYRSPGAPEAFLRTILPAPAPR